MFSKRLKQFFLANAISKQKTALFVSLPNKDTYKLMQYFCIPSDPRTKSFNELFLIFEEHFYPPNRSAS